MRFLRLLNGLCVHGSLAFLLYYPALVLSAPTGGEVVSGEGHIEQQGKRTDVIQRSGHMVVDWQEFNIGQQEHVHFEQPDTGAAVLNRVYQGGESQILGRMTGRGQVWLLNPNGVLFGRGARVEVGSLVAAGLWMDAGDFMAGRYVLDARHGAGRVHNAGILEASSVGLAGSSVENTGQVLAYSGHVELAAGTEVAVDFAGDGLLRFAVREGSGGEVLNTGELSGKAVALSARAASQVFSGVLNTGQQAAGLSRDAQGRVRLTVTSEIQAENVTAEGETIAVAGIVDVSGDQGEGGQVQLSGMESVVLSGSINASSSVAAGGRVAVVAEQIEVLASTRVDVSGARGGGQIEIGGGYRGARVLGRTAESLTVASGAEFRADATAHGDGGQAVFWSEGTTRFGGYASARGGEHSGDGGQVEVSGREHLWWGGRADLRAPHGRTGELLLDPGTVRICDDTDTTGCVASGMDVFTDAALVTMLGTADVTIATSAASSGTEDINVDSAVEVDWGSTSTNTLTLDAGNDINLAGTFTAAAGTLALNVGGTLSLGEASLAVGTVSAGQLTSSTGDQTLSGPTAGATWTVNGGGAGNLVYGSQTVGFTGMEHLAGGTGVDSFTVTAAHTGNLSGGDGNDVFSLGAVVTGTVSGGSDDDRYELGAGGQVTGGITDASGDDTLVSTTTAAAIFTLAGSATYESGSLTTRFSDIETLQGGDGADTFTVSSGRSIALSGGGGADMFNIGAALTGTVSGDAGDDTFTLQASGSATDLDGGADTDTLQGRDEIVTWTLADTGSNYGGSQSFQNIETLQGGSGADTFTATAAFTGTLSGGGGTDTLQGRDAAVTWVLNGADAGTYDGQVFTAIENLAGGSAADTFALNSGGALSGSITGNAGRNIYTLAGGSATGGITAGADGDTFTVTMAYTGDLTGGGGADVFEIGAVVTGTVSGGGSDERYELGVGGQVTGGITDTSGDDTLVSTTTAGAIFTLAGSATYESGSLTTRFSDIETLQGGDGADTFTVSSGRSIALSGGGGADMFNIGAALTGTVSGDAGEDTFTLQSSGSATDLDGGADTDTLQGRDEAVTWTLADTGSNYGGSQSFQNIETLQGGSGADTFTATAAFTGTLSGGGGTDTLQGRDAAVTWVLNGADAGTYDGQVYTAIENLAGGSGVDTFTLSPGGTLSGAIAGNAGRNIYTLAGGSATGGITAGADGDTFTVTMAYTGDLTGGGGQDTFQLGAVVTGTVSGGGDDDRYELGVGGQVTGGITDPGGDDTLVSTTTAGSTFTLAGSATYESGSLTTRFSDIETLQGGDGADTFTVSSGRSIALSGGGGADMFNIGAALTGTVSGDAGDDTFTLQTSGSATDLDGGADTDTLQGRDEVVTWTLADTGSNYGGSQSFQNIETLQGGSSADTFTATAAFTGTLSGGGGTDTLQGRDAAVTWVLNGADAGTYDGQAFTAIENLAGGSAVDTFALNSGGALSGSITGNAGGNSYTLAGGSATGGITAGADGDTFAVTVAYTGDLTGGGGTDVFEIGAVVTGTVSGGGGDDRYELGAGGQVTGGITDPGGDDTLVSTTTAGAIFTLAGSATYESGSLTTRFSDIETLQGGDGADTFTVSSGRSIALSGGGGADMFNIGAALTGTVSGDAGEDTFTLQASGSATDLDGGADTDTLQGRDEAVTWTLADTGSNYGGSQSFQNIETLQGGSGADTFTATAAFTGTLSGGGGTDTLQGRDAAVTWELNGADAGTYDGQVYTAIENLAGGSGVDTFTLSPGGTLSGAIAGNAGRNIYTLAGGSATGGITAGADGDTFAVTMDYTGDLTGGGGQDTFQLGAVVTGTVSGGGGDDRYELGAGGQVTGGITDPGGADDTLVSTTTAGAIFTLAGSTTYESGSLTTRFSDIETLQGGDGADTFTVSSGRSIALSGGGGADMFNIGAALTGTVSGGGGADAFDIDAAVIGNLMGGADNDTFMLGAAVTGTVSGDAGEDTFTLQASGSATALDGGLDTDTLQGRDEAVTWTITATGNQYGSQSFQNMETLQGGDGVDTFAVTAAYTGTLSGGGGDDIFALDVTLSGSLDGGADSDTLQGGDAAVTWELNGADAGTYDGQAFTAIENLAGGSGVDTFTLSPGGTLSGAIAGNAGGNTYTLAGGSATGGITAGADGDTFAVTMDYTGDLTGGGGQDTFQLGAVVTGTVSGGGGDDRYELGAGGQVTGGITDTGGDDDTLVSTTTAGATFTLAVSTTYASGGLTTGFSDIENLQGGDGVDTFAVTAVHTGDLSGGGGADAFDIDAAVTGDLTGDADGDSFMLGAAVTGTVSGAAGDDTFTLQTSGSATALDGGLDTDILQGRDEAVTWTITDTGNQYGSQSFQNMETLRGGGGVDTFAVTAAYTGTLSGGGGADVFDLDAALSGSLDGGADSDTLQGRDAAVTWVLNGADAGTYDGQAFTTIENLEGGSDVDTFTLDSGGMLSGSIAGNAGRNIYTLAGGSAAGGITAGADGDTFTVTTAYTGDLTGGGSADTFTLGAAVTGMVSGGGGDDRYELGAGGQVSDGIMDAAGDDTLVSTTTAGATFTVSGTGSGRYQSATDLTDFSGIESLTGGTGSDNFVFNAGGSLQGSLTGGMGMNTLDFSAVSTPVAVMLQTVSDSRFDGAVTAVTDGFTGITALLGGSGTDTLTGLDVDATWTLEDAPATDDSYAASGATLSFQAMETLTGGAMADTFNINGHSGSLSGDGGADTFNFMAGTVSGAVAGDGEDDSFVFTSGRAGGDLLGGLGNDHLDFSSVTTAIAVMLSGSGTSDGFMGTADSMTFDDIDELSGSALAGDGLSGMDAAAAWTLDSGGDRYALAGGGRALSFRNMETLAGGDNTDRFMVDRVFTGSVDGGAGSDNYIFSAAGQVTGTGIADSAATGTDALQTGTADSAGATFTVTGMGSGSYQSAAASTDFSGIESLAGGTGPDNFVFNAGGGLQGSLTGGMGTNTLDFRAVSTPVAVMLQTVSDSRFDGAVTTVTDGFTGVTRLLGGSGTDTLTGLNADATWTLEDAPATDDSYEASSATLSFQSMETLTGGSMADTFNINGHTGNLLGAAGADVFNLMAGTVRGSLSGDAGTDSFSFAGGTVDGAVDGGSEADRFVFVEPGAAFAAAVITGQLQGGAGSDLLDYSAAVAPIAVTLATADSTGFTGTATALGGGFAGINELVGSQADDTLTGQDSLDAEWRLTNLLSGTYALGSFEFGFAAIERINGGDTAADVLNARPYLSGNPVTIFLYPDSGAEGQGTVRAAVLTEPDSIAGIPAQVQEVQTVVQFSNIDQLQGEVSDTVVVTAVPFAPSADAAAQTAAGYTAATPGTITVMDLVINPVGAESASVVTLPDLTGFLGPTLIGGTLLPPLNSFSADDPEQFAFPAVLPNERIIHTSNLTLAGLVQTGGTLVLQAGELHLQANIGAGVDPESASASDDVKSLDSELILTAVGEAYFSQTFGNPDANNDVYTEPSLLVPELGTATPDGNIHIDFAPLPGVSQLVVYAGSGVVIAAEDIVNPLDLQADFGGADPTRDSLQAALGARSTVALNPLSLFASLGLTASIDTYIREALNLGGLQSAVFIFSTVATDLASLGSSLFIDVSLFEQELSLYGTVGYGLALALAQCEEQEGCAPAVSIAEMEAIIQDLQQRIETLHSQPATRSQQGELLRLQDRLQQFQQLRQEFIDLGLGAVLPGHIRLHLADFSLIPRLRQLWRDAIRLILLERLQGLAMQAQLTPATPQSCLPGTPCPTGSPG